MVVSREFRDQLPVAILCLLLSVMALVTLSAPASEGQQIATLWVENASALAAE